MQYGMKIGNEMHKDGVNETADALIKMMTCNADQKTIRAAIKAFSTLAEVRNVNVSNCHIQGDGATDDQVSKWIKDAVSAGMSHDDEQTERLCKASQEYLDSLDDE